MIKVPYDVEIERVVDQDVKGIYAACQALANGTPLLGYLLLFDENGNPVKVSETNL